MSSTAEPQLKGYLARNEGHDPEDDTVGPGEADELVPVSRHHVGDVEPGHEGHWDLIGKSERMTVRFAVLQYSSFNFFSFLLILNLVLCWDIGHLMIPAGKVAMTNLSKMPRAFSQIYLYARISLPTEIKVPQN